MVEIHTERNRQKEAAEAKSRVYRCRRWAEKFRLTEHVSNINGDKFKDAFISQGSPIILYFEHDSPYPTVLMA